MVRTVAILGQGDLNHRVAGSRADELGRHVEHGVAPALAGDLDDHLPGPDHLAGLGALVGHGALGVRVEVGVAQLFLRIAQLGLGRVDVRLGCLEPLLGLVEQNAGGEALFHQAPAGARRCFAPG